MSLSPEEWKAKMMQGCGSCQFLLICFIKKRIDEAIHVGWPPKLAWPLEGDIYPELYYLLAQNCSAYKKGKTT